MQQLQNTKELDSCEENLSHDLWKERFLKESVMRSRFGVLTTILRKVKIF